MKPRLLMVVNDPQFFLSHRLPVAKAAQEFFDVHIATGSGSAITDIIEAGFTHHVLPLERSGTALLSEWRLLRSLWKLYGNLKPALCHHVTIKPVLYGSLAAKLCRHLAVVNAIPGLGFVYTGKTYKQKLLKTIVTNLYRLALRGTYTIFQNPDNFSYFTEQKLLNPKNAILVKGSGIDLQAFHYSPQPATRPIKIILPARMLWDKGVGEFVQAAERIRKTRMDIVFQLIGDSDLGNPSGISTVQLQAWHDSGVIEWLGFQSKMIPHFQQAHVVCLPSYLEGLPKSLIEACAIGRPIITTDVPGCRETVQHQVNGLLVPARDSAALESAILELADAPERRESFGRASREWAEQNFSIDRVIEQHLELYKRALSAKS